MATKFVCAIGPGQDDYSGRLNWEAGTQCDLTAAATKVFGHGGITGTLSDNDSVTGQTSGATGTVVHCTSTQILIESISGSFQSGEQIYETEDTNYVVTSDAGDSAYVVGECATTGPVDDGAVTIAGATVDSSHYRMLQAADSHRARQPWDNTKYRCTYTGASNSRTLKIEEDYVRLVNLQIDYEGTGQYGYCIENYNSYLTVDGCILRFSGTGTDGYCFSWSGTGETGAVIKNSFLYGASKGGIWVSISSATECLDLYNLTIYDSYRGVYYNNNDVRDCINVISYNNSDYDFCTISASTFAYNFSKDDTAGTGTGCIRGDTDGKTPDFVSTTAGSEDFHIQSTSDCVGAGLASGGPYPNIPTEDFEGDDRGTTVDIGADEYLPTVEFLCDVGPGQTDYTSAANWEAGTECDLMAATTLTYGGSRTGSISDNASVTLYRGEVSQGVTATVVHATSTQVLLESISDTGTPQNGDEWRVDASNYFTTSDTGSKTKAVGLAATTGAKDSSTRARITGATIDSTHYRELRAASGHEATMPFDTNRYIYNHNNITYPLFWIEENYFRLTDIQVYYDGIGNNARMIYSTALYTIIDGCVGWFDSSASGGRVIELNNPNLTGSVVKNSFIYSDPNNPAQIGIFCHCANSDKAIDVINTTVYGTNYGIYDFNDARDLINVISYNNNVSDFYHCNSCRTFSNCFSKDTTADGTDCINGDADGKTPDFVSTTAGSEDFHLLSTSDCIGAGLGNGSNANVPTEDFEGDTRGAGATCDIGADEYPPPPVLETIYVDTGGTGDYTSYQNAIDDDFGLGGSSLVSLNKYVKVLGRCTDGAADTKIHCNGFTTDDTHTITFDVEAAYRHPGCVVLTGNKVRLVSATDPPVKIQDDYVTVKNIAAHHISAAGGYSSCFYADTDEVLFENCVGLVTGVGAENYGFYVDLSAGNTVKARNCSVAVTSAATCYGVYEAASSSGAAHLHNCSVYSNGYGYKALSGGSSCLALRNCLLWAPTTGQGTLQSGGVTSNNVYKTSAGAGSYDWIDYSDKTEEKLLYDPAGGNLLMYLDQAVRDGTNLYADANLAVTTDVTGAARPSSGAFYVGLHVPTEMSPLFRPTEREGLQHHLSAWGLSALFRGLERDDDEHPIPVEREGYSR